jgi:6-phosphogluconolactonase
MRVKAGRDASFDRHAMRSSEGAAMSTDDADQDKLSGLQAMMELPGHVHVEAEADAVYDNLAEGLWREAKDAIDQRGEFHLALSGGGAPQPFYRRLVIEPQYREFPWEKTHIWIVDERRVPEDDERSNIGMIRQLVTDHVPLRSRQIHPMPVLSEQPAEQYEQELRETIGGDPPRLDFVLLGMGSDCHTASLFPRSGAIDVSDRLVAVNDDEPVTPPPRVTMTFPLINAARAVVVLIIGSNKAEALGQVEQQWRLGKRDPARLPITGVGPAEGTLGWYLDAAATGVVS